MSTPVGPQDSASIRAVKEELEAARVALRTAEETYAKDERAAQAALSQSGRSYDARAAKARNVERLTKALATLEGKGDD